MFANEGHKVSQKQKTVESGIALNGSASSFLIQGGGKLHLNNLEKLSFSKNNRGEFEVQNYYNSATGQFDGPRKTIQSFREQMKISLTSELAKQTLQSRPDLKALVQPFSKIQETILNANETLGFVATNVTEFRTPEKKAAFMEKYPWYQTKKAANDACIMSKDEGCIQ